MQKYGKVYNWLIMNGKILLSSGKLPYKYRYLYYTMKNLSLFRLIKNNDPRQTGNNPGPSIHARMKIRIYWASGKIRIYCAWDIFVYIHKKRGLWSSSFFVQVRELLESARRQVKLYRIVFHVENLNITNHLESVSFQSGNDLAYWPKIWIIYACH